MVGNWSFLVIPFLLSFSTQVFEKEHLVLEIPHPLVWLGDDGKGVAIGGEFRDQNGERFDFDFLTNTFTYTTSRGGKIQDGVYEGNLCSVKDTKTGKVQQQGNFIFYYNGTSCCYDVKLVAKKLLVLDMVWNKKDFDRGEYPTTNLKYDPK